jgi:hypothetical protein
MANTDRFLIAPYNTGLQTDLKPWIIPDDAFATLKNAYVFRGRVRKRVGAYLMNGVVSNKEAQLYSRLRINLGNTNAITGNFSATVPGAIFTIGQMFSVNSTSSSTLDEMYTVYQAGTPAATLSTSLTGTATYDTTSGAFVLTGSSYLNSPVYFYPATAVTGIIRYYNDEIDDEPLFAFDQQFAYTWNTAEQAWERSSAATNPGDATWTGASYQYMWGFNYRGEAASNYYLFVVNDNAADGIRFWDGTHWNTLTAATSASANYNVQTASMIVAFNHRLVVLNTTELVNNQQFTYVNRARYSASYVDPTSATAWYTQTGLGGFIDAPTKESIISSEFVKDRLIVYFENSTWELAITGNNIDPFVWQKINTELGSESTFSIVPFDKVVLAIDEVGIHACNGSNVERIDAKIPDTIWNVGIPEQGPMRVYGIRDYKTEMVYWAYPTTNRYNVYPNEILVYNYRNGSFAQFDDNITVFGYFEQQARATWEDTTRTWEEIDEPWNSSRFQADSLQVIAGNQEGFTFIFDEDTDRNAPALQITNLTYSTATNIITMLVDDHNLSGGEYLLVENVQGVTNINGNIYQYQVTGFDDIDTLTFYGATTGGFTGVYTGGGTLTLVSQINIQTKQYNFYNKVGVNASINKVDFLVDNSSTGEITVDYFVSSGTNSLVTAGLANGTLMGTGVLTTSPYTLYPYESSQERFWHPIYPIAQGEVIQFVLYLSDAEMLNPSISLTNFELHALCIYATPTGRFE